MKHARGICCCCGKEVAIWPKDGRVRTHTFDRKPCPGSLMVAERIIEDRKPTGREKDIIIESLRKDVRERDRRIESLVKVIKNLTKPKKKPRYDEVYEQGIEWLNKQ